MYSFTKMIVLLLPALFASWNSTVLAMSPASLSISQNSNEVKNLRQGLQDSLIERTPSSLESKNKLIKPQVLKYMVAIVIMVSVAYFVIRCVRSFSKTKSLRRLAGNDDEGACGGAEGDEGSDIEASDDEDGDGYIHTSEDDSDEFRAFEKQEHKCREHDQQMLIMKGELELFHAFEMEHKLSMLEDKIKELEDEAEKNHLIILKAALQEAWKKLLIKEMDEIEDEEERKVAEEELLQLQATEIRAISDEERETWIKHQLELMAKAESELKQLRKEVDEADDAKKRQERLAKKAAAAEDTVVEEDAVTELEKLAVDDQ